MKKVCQDTWAICIITTVTHLSYAYRYALVNRIFDCKDKRWIWRSIPISVNFAHFIRQNDGWHTSLIMLANGEWTRVISGRQIVIIHARSNCKTQMLCLWKTNYLIEYCIFRLSRIHLHSSAARHMFALSSVCCCQYSRKIALIHSYICVRCT